MVGWTCLQQYCSQPAVPASNLQTLTGGRWMWVMLAATSLSKLGQSRPGEIFSPLRSGCGLCVALNWEITILQTSHLEYNSESKQSQWLFFNFLRTLDTKVTGNVRSFQQVSKVFIISSESEKKPNPNVQPGWFSSLENDRESLTRSWFSSPSRPSQALAKTLLKDSLRCDAINYNLQWSTLIWSAVPFVPLISIWIKFN